MFSKILDILVIIILIISILYFIFKRIKDKRAENFEKRNN